MMNPEDYLASGPGSGVQQPHVRAPPQHRMPSPQGSAGAGGGRGQSQAGSGAVKHVILPDIPREKIEFLPPKQVGWRARRGWEGGVGRWGWEEGGRCLLRVCVCLCVCMRLGGWVGRERWAEGGEWGEAEWVGV